MGAGLWEHYPQIKGSYEPAHGWIIGLEQWVCKVPHGMCMYMYQCMTRLLSMTHKRSHSKPVQWLIGLQIVSLYDGIP